MRLLHLSDWHLGKTLYKQPRTEDHAAVIEEMIGIAKEAKPDLILHTGDLFDALRPSTEVLHQGVEALKELSEIAPVVALCGNHDYPRLFALFNRLIGDIGERRLTFVDLVKPPESGGILEYPSQDGEIIRLAALPFIHANRRVRTYEGFFEQMDGDPKSYDDRIGKIETDLGRGLRKDSNPSKDVLIFAAHLMISGAKLSGSERSVHTSDMYATESRHVPLGLSYAAFGHIHKPQKLPGRTSYGRYAGSPLQLDFGEEGEAKSLVLVEAKPGKPAHKMEEISLRAGRRLKKLEGTPEELKAEASKVTDEILSVIVKTEKPMPEASDFVDGLFPKAAVVRIVEDCAATRVEVLTEDETKAEERSITQLFEEYLREVGTKSAEKNRVLKSFSELLSGEETSQTPNEELPEEARVAGA